MQKLYAQHCFDIGSRIQDVFAIFQVSETYGEGEKERSLSEKEVSDLIDLLGKIKQLCMQLPLATSCEVVKRNMRDPPRTFREWQRVVELLEIEMQGIFFLSIPQHLVRYYEDDSMLDVPTQEAFPHLNREMRNAGNAHAMGLPTACVFHCMRALEHALKALAERVGLTWTSEQWHTIIEAIEAKIKELRGSKKSPERDEEVHFLSKVAKEFFYFKDGWRNYVAHNKIDYQEAQAQTILEHVASFADILAAKLKEEPDPIQASAAEC